MGMSHLGYVAYLAMVVALYGSPVIAYMLYRGWRRGQLARTLAQIGVAVPVIAVLGYVLMR